MTDSTNRQVAIVTGGGTGLGRGICIELAKKGIIVVITGRREQLLNETKEIIEKDGGKAECYRLDVTDKENVADVMAKVYKKYGRLDILVSNAGNLSEPAFITETTDEAWDSVIKTHLYGAFYCIREAARYMRKAKYGRILIISSVAMINGFNGAANYAASKGALEAMTKTAAKEFGQWGITVNCIEPGIIATPMADPFLDAMGETFSSETPMGRNGVPKDIGVAAAFYCSPEAEFVTGTVLRVDGGYMLQSSMDQFVFKAYKVPEE